MSTRAIREVEFEFDAEAMGLILTFRRPCPVASLTATVIPPPLAIALG